MLIQGDLSPNEYAISNGLIQESNEEEIEGLVSKVLDNNPEIVERIAKHYEYSIKNLNKINTKTLKLKAARPAKTGFVLDKAKNVLGYHPHSFEESLVIIDKQLST